MEIWLVTFLTTLTSDSLTEVQKVFCGAKKGLKGKAMGQVFKP